MYYLAIKFSNGKYIAPLRKFSRNKNTLLEFGYKKNFKSTSKDSLLRIHFIMTFKNKIFERGYNT